MDLQYTGKEDLKEVERLEDTLGEMGTISFVPVSMILGKREEYHCTFRSKKGNIEIRRRVDAAQPYEEILEGMLMRIKSRLWLRCESLIK